MNRSKRYRWVNLLGGAACMLASACARHTDEPKSDNSTPTIGVLRQPLSTLSTVLNLDSATTGGYPNTVTPALSGSLLFGVGTSGGVGASGAVFSVDTAVPSAVPTVLHSFQSGTADGASPMGGVVVVGSNLYGATVSGGANDRGGIYRLAADGSSFVLLHSFDASTDGQGAYGTLAIDQVAGRLYGALTLSGPRAKGSIYGMNWMDRISRSCMPSRWTARMAVTPMRSRSTKTA